MVRPEVANSARSPATEVPASRTETVVPTASDICEARVRCQISS